MNELITLLRNIRSLNDREVLSLVVKVLELLTKENKCGEFVPNNHMLLILDNTTEFSIEFDIKKNIFRLPSSFLVYEYTDKIATFYVECPPTMILHSNNDKIVSENSQVEKTVNYTFVRDSQGHIFRK